jgi:chromosome segregation ATPase
MATKEEYQAKMESQLKDVTAKLADLMAKADQATSGAKEKYHGQISALKAKLQDTEGRLRELKSSGGDAWTALRDGTEKAWSELRGAVDGALSKFKQSEGPKKK